jgi:DNA mismatch endonuclease (patch repair protein)
VSKLAIIKPNAARAATMRAVKSRDTGAELLVRKILHRIAPGYRLDRKDIPGRPDIAYIGAKRAIFVHGCFWHGHDCRRGARVPKTNRDYWLAKVARNRARDVKHLETLEEKGWRTLVLWECELKDAEGLEKRLRGFLQSTLHAPSPTFGGRRKAAYHGSSV